MKNLQTGFTVSIFLLIIFLLVMGGSIYFYENEKVESIPTIDAKSNQVQQTSMQNPTTNNFSASSTKPIKTVTSIKSGSSVNATSTLLIIQTTGGLCQYGGCSSKITLKKDGVFIQEEGDGKTKNGNLGVDAVRNLQNLIESSNYSLLRSTPFTEMCPIAYDGSEWTYKFQTSHGEEIIDSCQTKIDSSHPLFKEIENILNRM